MPERYKTIQETQEALGVSSVTVYSLLKKGKLQRVPNHSRGSKGRPVTLVSVSSIVNYIKTN